MYQITFVVVVYVSLFYASKCAEPNMRTCSESDFHYEYTSCDSQGGRWRVSVPSPDTCVGGSPEPPVRGQSCDFTCDPGEYLDVSNDQDCHPCNPGEYSLGGGVLYQNWNSIPLGFSARIEPYTFDENIYDYRALDHSCDQMGWQAKGRYIATNNSECVAELTYSAKLVREGTITFEYRFVDDGESSLFTFDVDNSECQSVSDETETVYLEKTEANEWATKTVELPAGVSILYWRSIVIGSDVKSNVQKYQKLISIQSIAITGVAFTSDCTPCAPGSYSSTVGAEICTECPENTYSGTGATSCTPCDESQYSEPGSAQCTNRPICTVDHYIALYEPCIAGNTKKVYSWIEPHVCHGGVSLPSDGQWEKCPACNVGMQLINGTCQFCRANEYSDGTSSCTACPGSTAAQIGVVYKRWDNLPPNANITTHCVSLHDRGTGTACLSRDGWTRKSDYLQTVAINADDAFLFVTMDVGGFRSNQRAADGEVLTGMNAEISFVFDTTCSDRSCQFLFFVQEQGKKVHLAWSYTGSTEKKAYRFPIAVSTGVKFSWIYRKSVSSSGFALRNDYARLYLINITNTLNGGAESCRQCPQGASQDGCLPCAMGEYIDPATVQCTKCPQGKVVSSSSAWGVDSCVSCGPGLHDYKGQRCVSDCQYHPSVGNGRYNFSRLGSLLTVKGPKLFTSSGDAYYHLMNISLCGNNGKFPLASCSSNMTNAKNTAGSNNVAATSISAFVCQSTMLLPKATKEKAESVVSVSPISLGSRLIAVTDRADETIQKLMSDAQFTRSHEQNKNESGDIYMLYTSDTPTAACKQGRNVTVILRCVVDTDEPDDLVMLPRECSDGTCDGCNFVLLINSSSACPVCTEVDFDVYSTQCSNGVETLVRKMIRACHNENNKFNLTAVTTTCSEYWQRQWPIWLKVVVILVPVLVVGGAVLLLAVVYCWARNRSLEYKYMKLIESSSSSYGNTTELAAADTCALHDGEEEEEEFDAVKVRKGKKFFGKFKLGQSTSAARNLDEDELFESMRMSEKSSMS